MNWKQSFQKSRVQTSLGVIKTSGRKGTEKTEQGRVIFHAEDQKGLRKNLTEQYSISFINIKPVYKYKVSRSSYSILTICNLVEMSSETGKRGITHSSSECQAEKHKPCCYDMSNEHYPGCHCGHIDSTPCEHNDTHQGHHHSHSHNDHHEDEECQWLYEITHKGTTGPEETCKKYDKHAYAFDKFVNEHGCQQYNFVVNGMMDVLKDKNSRILDVGAGTGANGKLLKENGYSNIDALDGSDGMLQIAKTKNVYQNLINIILKDGVCIPNTRNDTYTAVVMNGVFCPNHCDSSIFPELIRVVKPGGYICWVMNVDEEIDEEKFNRDVETLCKKKQWKLVKKKTHNGYCGDEKVTIMEVL